MANAPLFDTRVTRVTYTGGIIGLFSDRNRQLQLAIGAHYGEGYRLRHVLPGRPSIIWTIIQLFCLMITLLLWAPEPGETLIFERQT